MPHTLSVRPPDRWAFVKDPASDLFDVLLKVREDNLTFSQWVQRRINDSGESKSDVVRRSHLDRVFAYQLISGVRRGTRNKLIMLARGMQLGLEDTCELLERGGVCGLRPQSRRDVAIAYCIVHDYRVPECDEVLSRADMQPLRAGFGQQES